MSPPSEQLARFRELERDFRSPRTGRRGHGLLVQDAFRVANIELYQLAQAICAGSEPEVQQRLDRVRTRIVELLESRNNATMQDCTLRPTRMKRPIRWSEYMLTPELEGDLALTGAAVPRELALELRVAHREQIRTVREVVGL